MQALARATANVSLPQAAWWRSRLSFVYRVRVARQNREWNADTLQGNPMLRLSAGDIQQLLQHLHVQQIKTSGSAKLLYIRDSLAISCLWQSTIRGFNAGSTRLHNIKLPTNKSAVFFLTPEVKLQPGAQLHTMLDRTKNKNGGRYTI